MFAIRNRRTRQWLFGTDWNYNPPRQRLANDWAEVFRSREQGEFEFRRRQCSEKTYRLCEVQIIEIRDSGKRYQITITELSVEGE
jgi:hypothetical protein